MKYKIPKLTINRVYPATHKIFIMLFKDEADFTKVSKVIIDVRENVSKKLLCKYVPFSQIFQ